VQHGAAGALSPSPWCASIADTAMTSLAAHVATPDDRYRFSDFTLDKIRNRQEARVAAAMRSLLPGAEGFCGCRLCVEDVYAIALNALPPHYVQSGSIVLRKNPPTDADVERAVSDALDKVRVRPNHPE
jgi:Late competence development protein ComFB